MTYDPAMCLTLKVNAKRQATALYVILAADGTPLDAQEHAPETLPRWITSSVQFPVMESVKHLRRWRNDYPALRS